MLSSCLRSSVASSRCPPSFICSSPICNVSFFLWLLFYNFLFTFCLRQFDMMRLGDFYLLLHCCRFTKTFGSAGFCFHPICKLMNWESSCNIFSAYSLFFLSSGSPITPLSDHLILSYRSLKLCSSSFQSFYYYYCYYYNNVQLASV